MKINKKFKKDLKKYYSSIRKVLVCSLVMKLTFLSDFNSNILQYAKEYNIDSIESIIDHFGTPDEISNGFFTDNDIEKLKKKTKRNTIYIVFGTLMFIFIFFLVMCFTNVISSFNIDITGSSNNT